MLFIGIWASMLDGVTIVVDNFVMSPLVGVEKCSCSLVKTCENSRRLFACMLCEWRDSTLAIGKERREDVALFAWSRCHDFTVIVVGQPCGGVRMRGWIIPSVEGHLQSLDVTMRHTMDPHEHRLCD